MMADESEQEALAQTISVDRVAQLGGDSSVPWTVDHYQVQELISQGGQGRIWKAIDKRLQRPVALKELLGHNDSNRERLRREALLTARLQHSSIVPVYELGVWPSGRLFFAMRLLVGRTLRADINNTQTLSERICLLPKLIRAIEAISYAHSQGIIHRDIKPGNIFCTEQDEVIVIDWRLAKDLHSCVEISPNTNKNKSEDPELTQTGAVLGTAQYMSPEQASGSPVDARTDIYSIGATMYQLLSGKKPYPGKTSQEIICHLDRGEPAPLDTNGLPNILGEIIQKAMAPDPRDRYPTARELLAKLRSFGVG